MADSSPPGRERAASPVPALKRTAASLLPAFEPLSSSPALPRPLKRTRDAFEEIRTYPTPVPTSSTAILSSSPPRATEVRSSLHRTLSTLSERAPLSAVPSVVLNNDGAPTRLGRSSASCEYQFSANRLISRVHVEATYKPSTSRLDRARVEVFCSGWNGIKLHCQSKVYDLKKGETFTSDIRDQEIMLDVHGNRVVLQWPEKPHLGPISSDEEEEFVTTSKKQRAMRRHSTPPSPSPLQSRKRVASPVSPSPAVRDLIPSSPPFMPVIEHANLVEIYEDPVLPTTESSEAQSSHYSEQPTQKISQSIDVGSQLQSENLGSSNDFSDNDEENDPIIHSFGPFGANLLPRMAAVKASDTPRQSSSTKGSRLSNVEPLQQSQSQSQSQARQSSSDVDVKGHVINQLAYSRLSSTPLSIILSHLPQETQNLTKEELRRILRATDCIGEVKREGKDAAGKALESEFYYLPDNDDDEMRKQAVVNDLRKPGLRACRKQHKQYFWRKPK